MSFGEVLIITVVVFLTFDLIVEYVKGKIIAEIDKVLEAYEREKRRQKIERTCQECIDYINTAILQKESNNPR